mmetsp:Transcript_4311/g.16124  ORF Transcript_4311/g.16124 Transcript_4311/m.16124 type:complete len:118 (-) Transcript_4311:738-1091(-)
MIGFVRLMLIDATKILLRGTTNIWVHFDDVGVCVMPNDVLLPPHERRRPNNIESELHSMHECSRFSERSVIRIVLNGDTDLSFTDPMSHSKNKSNRDRSTEEKTAIMKTNHAREYTY